MTDPITPARLIELATLAEERADTAYDNLRVYGVTNADVAERDQHEHREYAAALRAAADQREADIEAMRVAAANADHIAIGLASGDTKEQARTKLREMIARLNRAIAGGSQ